MPGWGVRAGLASSAFLRAHVDECSPEGAGQLSPPGEVGGPQRLCSKGSCGHRQTQTHRWAAQPCPRLHSTDRAGARRASGIKRLMAVAPWTLHICWGYLQGRTSPACGGEGVGGGEAWPAPSLKGGHGHQDTHHSPAGGDGDSPHPTPRPALGAPIARKC